MSIASSLRPLLTRVMSTGLFWTACVTFLRCIGFVFVLPVVLKSIPTDDIGLWYVYGGIVGVCGMVEMGFSPIIGRFASYYWAGLQAVPSLDSFTAFRTKSEINRNGLAGLIRMARHLYAAFALFILLSMTTGGTLWLWWKYQLAFMNPYNFLAFALLALGTSWSMKGYYWSGLLFGINRVQAYQKAVLVGIVLNYLVILLGLFLHIGIISLVLGQIIMTLYQRYRSCYLFRQFVDLSKDVQPMPIRWQHLWPMTWRGGLMGYGAYLSLSAVTLSCAQVFDLATTASFALSLQLVFMIHSTANTWLLVKYPLISTLYVQGQLKEIRRIVFHRICLQTITYVTLSLVTWKLVPLLLNYLGTKTHFLEPRFLALLMVVGAIDLIINSASTVVQSGNQFPFVYSKLANGLLTVLLAYFLGKWIGLPGLICAPAIAQLTFNGWYICRWFWRDLHRPDFEDSPLPHTVEMIAD